MRWIIQNSGDEKIAVGVIPFTDVIVGMDGIDNEAPTVFYGSTRLAEIASTKPFFPGVFYDKEWFDPYNWIGKRNDLLNENQAKITVGELRTNWIHNPTFVKSVDPKVLTGMVLEGEDRDWWVDEYDHLKDDDLIVVSPIQKIVQEWRFFILDGEVICGSQYKHDGVLRIREPIKDEVWVKAREMAQDWMPSQNIVMDICKLESGEYKVVEWNCLNCSGFYNCNVNDFVKTLNNKYGWKGQRVKIKP